MTQEVVRSERWRVLVIDPGELGCGQGKKKVNPRKLERGSLMRPAGGWGVRSGAEPGCFQAATPMCVVKQLGKRKLLLKPQIQLRQCWRSSWLCPSFSDQAASHLANRKELQGATHNGRLLQAKGGRARKIFLAKRELFQARSLSCPLVQARGISAEYPTSADQVVPHGLV